MQGKETKKDLIVIKQDANGNEKWRYPANLIIETGSLRVIEAFFNRPDLPFFGVLLRQGDRAIEKYYSDRWFNIYEIHDKDDDHIKAWYCNISRPAVFEEGCIRFDDLALDVLIYPDKRTLVVDEDEFEALDLDKATRQACWLAVETLLNLAATIEPFGLK